MAYIGTSPANGVRRKHTYTATAGQTSFSGADDNNVTLTYVDTEYLDVYQNGVKLVAVSDYASTTGTSVVLVQGASVDDTVEIIVFDVFSVADTVSAGSGGSFGGNIGIGGTLAVTGVSTLGANLNVTGNVVSNDGSNNARFQFDANNQILIQNDTAMYLYVNGSASLKVDAIGAVTKPLQPAFLARPASTQSNIPINANTTIVFGSEVFDQNGDFTNNTFTAPVTGKYQLNVQLLVQQMDKATDYYAFQLTTSNRNFWVYYDNDDKAADNSNGDGQHVIVLTDMDAGDTAYVIVSIPNNGAAQMDVVNGSAFSGYLVC